MEVVAEYSDVISGAKIDRDGLNTMFLDAAKKKFDSIMIVKIDRLARSLIHFVTIIQQLEDLGIALIVPNQGIDTSDQTPCGKLQRQILASVAEFERSLTQERIKSWFVAAKERGEKFGKPSKVMVSNPQEVVLEWKRAGGTYRDLARQLGGVSVSTAYRLAKEGS